MPNFKIKTIDNKPSLTLKDPVLFHIIQQLAMSDCDFDIEPNQDIFIFETDTIFDLMIDCIDTEYPTLSEQDIKYVLVTLKVVEHKGFKSLFLEK